MSVPSRRLGMQVTREAEAPGLTHTGDMDLAGETSIQIPRLPDAAPGGPRGATAGRSLRPVQRRTDGTSRGVVDAGCQNLLRHAVCPAQSAPVPLPATGRAVGVDLGVARFLTASDGQVIANPRFLTASADVIADF